jgi:predicted nuclease of restriction endonuclease-like RecB superfamily
MKKLCNYLYLLAFILYPFLGNAKEPTTDLERGSIHPGFIITLQGDTVKGYLLNINLWLNQRMTFFYTDPNDRNGRIKYTPKEIKAYQVGPRYYESFRHPFTNSTHSDNFLLRKQDGPIKYYVWYFDEDKSKLMVWDRISIADLGKAFLFEESELWKDEFAMRKGDKILIPFNLKFLLKFNKNMADYVKDYPELAQKIINKEEGYKNINIEAIIREYNEWHLHNH